MKELLNRLKNNFITKFIASNNYILAALIISPLLLYFVFGTTFYNTYDDAITQGDFGIPNDDSNKFYQYNGIPISKAYLDKTNPDGLNENITSKEQYVFRKSFFNSLVLSAEISFLIGASLSALSWGLMTEEGSIVYLIFSKSSREEAFLELFSFPLIFVLFISIAASLAISSEMLTIYLDKSMWNLSFISFVLLSGTMFGGYVFSSILSLISKNTFLPIFGSLLVVGSVSVLPESRDLVIPFETVMRNYQYGFPIDNEAYIGIILICLGVVGLYIIFKRRSFY